MKQRTHGDVRAELCRGPICSGARAIREVIAEDRCFLCLEAERPELAAALFAAAMGDMGTIAVDGRGYDA